MFKHFVLLFTLAFLWVTPSQAADMASWNIKHFGSAKKQQDWKRTAKTVSLFEFIALQEVMSPNAVSKLERELENLTHKKWASLVSHTNVGRGRYKEYYAFIWREDAVKYTGGAVVYLDPGDHFAREPFAANFADTRSGKEWTVANIHQIYGKTKARRVAEAKELDEYIKWLKADVAKHRPIFLMGDFNLNPHDPAFNELRPLLKQVVTGGNTTLRTIEGRYANHYDHIWVQRSLKTDKSGVFKFPQHLGITHEYARKHISDHAPVYVRW